MAAQFKVTNGRWVRGLKPMNGARDQFLARAGFPEDEDVGVGRGHHFRLPQHALQRGARAHHLLEFLFDLAWVFLDTLQPLRARAKPARN